MIQSGHERPQKNVMIRNWTEMFDLRCDVLDNFMLLPKGRQGLETWSYFIRSLTHFEHYMALLNAISYQSLNISTSSVSCLRESVGWFYAYAWVCY